MARLTKIRAHATYANVTATLALFVVLGGGSFAVATLSGSEKKVVKKIAKKQANRRITARAPGLAVKHARSADAASPTGAAGGDLTGIYPTPSIGAGTVGTAELADGAVTSAKLAGSTARAYARVRPGGGGGCPPQPCLIFEAKGISSVTHTGTGVYCVVAPGIDSADVTPAVSVDWGESNDPEGNASAMTNGGERCGDGGFVVHTERQPSTAVRNAADTGTTNVAGNAVAADDVGFAIVIP